MSKDQKIFYGAWACAWFTLAAFACQFLTFAEAWFVTFPVGWTIALLVVRHPFVMRLLVFLILLMKAWTWWIRAPHRNPFDKSGSVVLAIASLYFLWSFVVEAVKMWRGRKQRIQA